MVSCAPEAPDRLTNGMRHAPAESRRGRDSGLGGVRFEAHGLLGGVVEGRMPRITVHVPGEEPRGVEVGPEGVVVGRAEDAGVFIAEPRASRRHVRIAPHAGGGWLVQDLASANGTWVGEQRVARRRLDDGAAIRIGGTRIELGAPLSSLVTSTVLEIRLLEDEAASAASEAPPTRREVPPEPPAAGPADLSALWKGAVLLGLAVLVAFAVDRFLGADARRRDERATVRKGALDVLSGRVSDPAFPERAEAFAAKHAGTSEAERLTRHADAARKDIARRQSIEARLAAVHGRLGQGARADVRVDLVRLRAESGHDADLAKRVVDALLLADRADEEADAARFGAARAGVDAAIAAGRLGLADAYVASLEARRVGLGAGVAERLPELRDRVDRASRARYEAMRKQLASTPPEGRFEVLLAASRDLAGTSLTKLVDDQVRALARAGIAEDAGTTGSRTTPRERPTDGSTPAASSAPTAAALVRLGAAREDLARRRWASARAGFAALTDGGAGSDLAADARARIADLDRVLGLIGRLNDRAQANPFPVQLSTGRVVVTGAHGDVATWRAGDAAASAHPWGDLAPADVLTLITPPEPSVPDRLGLAIVAVALERRDAAIQALAPLYAQGADDRAHADAIVARHLYGLASVPEGGYRLHAGDLLDRGAFERAVEAERLASLRGEATTLLAHLAAEAPWKRIQKVLDLRTRLDVARRVALLAIFNETHYPYPYNAASKEYQAVQAEVARRVAAVEAIWNDDTSARVQRSGSLGRRLDRLERAIRELDAAKALPDDLRAASWPFLAYASSEALTVRTIFLDEDERARFAYDTWVRDVYNPARREVADAVETEQVAITNEYRRMIGFTASVQPGPKPYEGITSDTARAVLDEATLLRTAPLRAVRIDNRLVLAARDHSGDMMRRGYFSHFAPPNPETGAGTTAPHDRMAARGYAGWAMSENIALNTSALNAHRSWCTSSGHHRNILSPWEDLGVGHVAKRWTQNFGSGGGARPEIAPTTDVVEGARRGPPSSDAR